MAADYKTPQWLLPNELNMSLNPALSESRHSLYSMEFDGTSYIDLGTDLDIFRYNINESYSVSLWYKTTSALGDKTIINLGANTYKFFLTSGNSGKISFGAGASTSIGAIYNWLPTAGAINDGNWHHICIVQDSSGGSVNLTPYVDGSSSGSGSSTAFTVQVNNRIGDGHYGGVEASIDEVSIFSRALSASEVTTLYNSGAPGNLMALSAKPYAYYPLGEQAQMGYSNWNFPNESLQSHVVDFDGTDIATTGVSIAYADKPTWSISYWVKIDNSLLTNNTSFFAVGGSVSGTSAYNYGAGRLYYYTSTGTVVSFQGTSSVFGSTNIGDNKWHHILQVYEDQGADVQQTRIYVDGNSTPEVTGTTLSYYKNGGDLFFGFRKNGAAGTYDKLYIGELSNVALWNSDQSANLNNIYNNGSPQSTYTATPNNWWQLNAANSSYNPATSTWTFTDGPGTNDGTSTTLPSTALITSDLQFESPYSNYSLNFDGVDDYIDLGTTPIVTGVFSISMWIKRNSTSVGDASQVLIGKDNQSAARVFNIFITKSTGVLNFWVSSTGTYSSTYRVDTSTVINDTNWHNVVFLNKGDGQLNEIYIDGTEASYTAQGEGRSTLFNTTAIKTSIGADSLTGTTFDFNGKVDEVALWGSALTQTQINQIYNNGYPADLTSLSPSNWWRLGEDAFFVSNVVTIPNKITGGPSGTGGGGDQSAFLVGEAPGSYANGIGSSLDVLDRIGDAPESTANSVSINMIPSNRTSYSASYLPTQVNNVYSMEFDGVDDYIDVNTISLGTVQTVSYWIKRQNNPTFSQACPLGDTTSGLSGMLIYMNVNDFYYRVGGTNVAWMGSLSGTVGSWTHCAVIRNGASVTLYINGSSVSTQTLTGGDVSASVQVDTIGASAASTPAFYLKGNMDEVAIFDYALTAKQIKQDIYNGTTTGKTADLNNISNLTAPVAWYRMGD